MNEGTNECISAKVKINNNNNNNNNNKQKQMKKTDRSSITDESFSFSSVGDGLEDKWETQAPPVHAESLLQQSHANP